MLACAFTLHGRTYSLNTPLKHPRISRGRCAGRWRAVPGRLSTVERESQTARERPSRAHNAAGSELSRLHGVVYAEYTLLRPYMLIRSTNWPLQYSLRAVWRRSCAHHPAHVSALPGASRAAMRANIDIVGTHDVKDDVSTPVCAWASAHGRSRAKSWAWRARQARADATRKGQRSGSVAWNWG